MKSTTCKPCGCKRERALYSNELEYSLLNMHINIKDSKNLKLI